MAREAELKCPTVIRTPVGMAINLKEVAARNRRSINNQIMFYVEEGLARDMKEMGIEPSKVA